MRLCLFATSPDIYERSTNVPMLTGVPEELAERSLALGYDGFEYLPHPERVPEPEEFVRLLEKTGAVIPMVNTGRMVRHGLTLFHPDRAIALRACAAFIRMIDFAGAIGAPVGLGIARGPARSDLSEDEMNRLAEDVFGELAECAHRAGTSVLLEPAETQVTRFVLTIAEVMDWVDRIAERREAARSVAVPGGNDSVSSPRMRWESDMPEPPAPFRMMIDTHQLAESESSIAQALRDARGQAAHLHLFDHERDPPGTRANGFDWIEFFSLLEDDGYQGAASVTLPGKGQAQGPADVARFLRQYLR